jgi:hypothetical protein
MNRVEQFRRSLRHAGSWRRAAAIALAAVLIPLRVDAQEPSPAAKALKSEILEAQNIQRTFADGLQACAVLDGTRFFNGGQKRVILLSDLQASLQNLVKDQVFNPQKKRPWTAADAAERVKLAQSQADLDKRNCNLVARLPEMVKKLAELESKH